MDVILVLLELRNFDGLTLMLLITNLLSAAFTHNLCNFCACFTQAEFYNGKSNYLPAGVKFKKERMNTKPIRTYIKDIQSIQRDGGML